MTPIFRILQISSQEQTVNRGKPRGKRGREGETDETAAASTCPPGTAAQCSLRLSAPITLLLSGAWGQQFQIFGRLPTRALHLNSSCRMEFERGPGLS
jgi:hypothetical protein